MTEEKIVERVAREIASAMGEDPANINPLVSSDYFDAARAAIALLGPAPLEWDGYIGRGQRSHTTNSPKYAMAYYAGDYGPPVYRWAVEGGLWSEAFEDRAEAEAAAEAHHRAAWWEQTVAGKAE